MFSLKTLSWMHMHSGADQVTGTPYFWHIQTLLDFLTLKLFTCWKIVHRGGGQVGSVVLYHKVLDVNLGFCSKLRFLNRLFHIIWCFHLPKTVRIENLIFPLWSNKANYCVKMLLNSVQTVSITACSGFCPVSFAHVCWQQRNWKTKNFSVEEQDVPKGL